MRSLATSTGAPEESVLVNRTAKRGDSAVDAGTYENVEVIAVGDWMIEIVPRQRRESQSRKSRLGGHVTSRTGSVGAACESVDDAARVVAVLACAAVLDRVEPAGPVARQCADCEA